MSFTYTASAADWGRIAPELVLAAVALLVLLVALLLPQPGTGQEARGNFLGLPLLCLERRSLDLYVLGGFVGRRGTSQEASMKYFLLSSFASAFLLYGIAMIYGATGNTAFNAITKFLSTHTQSSTLLLIGMGLLIVGFAFKVSAVPFQAWTPDVYDGAPAPLTAFMSVGTKAASLIAFARGFDVVLPSIKSDWEPVVLALPILTLVGGNV